MKEVSQDVRLRDTLLDKHGLSDVGVVETSGYLTDHYDPRSKVIRLSRSVYNATSIAAVSVACHECGHAIQDKEGYTFLKNKKCLSTNRKLLILCRILCHFIWLLIWSPRFNLARNISRSSNTIIPSNYFTSRNQCLKTCPKRVRLCTLFK